MLSEEYEWFEERGQLCLCEWSTNEKSERKRIKI